ncbi:DUF2157 domain-containing protein, partial [Pseudonocardia lacus]|uniref:DUF2157 domain-containing protein n=1 Tax=Pseudonocardia lacus TaxID=2835865 RepID=UPI001BDD5805
MTSEQSPPPAVVAGLLRRWVDGGLITAEQAGRIRDAEGLDGTAPRDAAGAPAGEGAPPHRGASLVAEGLGYVGGALVLVAAVLIAGTFWDALGAGGRLALVLVAAGLLLGVGAAAPA